MATVLDHTILPVLDREASVHFYVDLIGLEDGGLLFDWAVIRVNEHLVIDLSEQAEAPHRHLAFAMDREGFEAAFARIRAAGLPFSDDPHIDDNQQGPGRTQGARGMADAVYTDDPSGHGIEIRCYGD